MSYQYITKYDSPNCNGYGVRNDIKYIVVHHWGADGQSFSGVMNWLCNPKSRVSAHYIVKDNTVACILNHNDCGWHAGDGWYNSHSIGIECRPEMTDGDIKTLVELIADLWKDIGHEVPIIGHKDIVATACPGRYYGRLSEIEKMAREVKNTGRIPLVPEKDKPEPRGEMYRVRKSWKNVASQLGAFRDINNAISQASQRGYNVYDNEGKCVWKPSSPKPPMVNSKKKIIMQGQSRANEILGTHIIVDGIRGVDTKKVGIMMLQWALNKDYGAGLVIDGIFGPATEKALGYHYVRRGETQYLATAVEVLLYLNGYDAGGVEVPGTIGNKCANAIGLYQKKNGLKQDQSAGRNTIKSLIK